jgi:hypothetical protein
VWRASTRGRAISPAGDNSIASYLPIESISRVAAASSPVAQPISRTTAFTGANGSKNRICVSNRCREVPSEHMAVFA